MLEARIPDLRLGTAQRVFHVKANVSIPASQVSPVLLSKHSPIELEYCKFPAVRTELVCTGGIVMHVNK